MESSIEIKTQHKREQEKEKKSSKDEAKANK